MASNAFATRRRDIVTVLDLDQELAEPLEDTRRARARPLSAARLLRRDAGTWDAKQDAAHAIGRSRQLASLQAIAQHHRLDDRLWLFFWELADRYGRVEPDSVRSWLLLGHAPDAAELLSRAGDAGGDGEPVG